MQYAIAGQSNRLSVDLVAAAGSDLSTGTCTVYLRATSGDNAGKWWDGAAGEWSAAVAAAGAASHVRQAEWEITIAAAAWSDGVRYRLSADHSGGADLSVSEQVLCVGTAYVPTSGGDTVVSVAEARAWMKRDASDDPNILLALLAAERFVADYTGIELDGDTLTATLRQAVLHLAGVFIRFPEGCVTGAAVAEVPFTVRAILDQARGVIV